MTRQRRTLRPRLVSRSDTRVDVGPAKWLTLGYRNISLLRFFRESCLAINIKVAEFLLLRVVQDLPVPEATVKDKDEIARVVVMECVFGKRVHVNVLLALNYKADVLTPKPPKILNNRFGVL